MGAQAGLGLAFDGMLQSQVNKQCHFERDYFLIHQIPNHEILVLITYSQKPLLKSHDAHNSSGVRFAMRTASQLPGRGTTDVDDAPAPAC